MLTIFRDDESVDLEGTARVVDYLIDGAADGLCLLANYSEQFSLTDADVTPLPARFFEHVAGRVPVIDPGSRRRGEGHDAKFDGARRTRPGRPGLPVGDRPGAVRAWEELLPLIHFENRQCGLRAQKILLREGGIIASERTRSPFGPVSPRTRRSLVELAAARDLLIMRWAG